MRYLVQELGPERFRAELAQRAAFLLDPAGEALTRRYRGDHVGVHPQRQPGLHYVGLNVTVGRMSGRNLVEAAAWPASTWRRRAGHTDQNLILTGVPSQRVDALLAELLLASTRPTRARSSGGWWPAPATSSAASRSSRPRPGRPPGPVSWTAGSGPTRPATASCACTSPGCPASCAQPQIADIGFREETAHRDDQILEAVDIGLGGSLGTDAAFIDWVEGAKPVDEVPEALAGLLTRYRAERRDGEAFHQWARRLPNAELRATPQGRRP